VLGALADTAPDGRGLLARANRAEQIAPLEPRHVGRSLRIEALERAQRARNVLREARVLDLALQQERTEAWRATASREHAPPFAIAGNSTSKLETWCSGRWLPSSTITSNLVG
jgi:hypothetical protein